MVTCSTSILITSFERLINWRVSIAISVIRNHRKCSTWVEKAVNFETTEETFKQLEAFSESSAIFQRLLSLYDDGVVFNLAWLMDLTSLYSQRIL